MRKVRDYDAELKALNDKAKALKAKKVQQLGQLVVAVGADIFEPNIIAGILREAVESHDEAEKEGWRKVGATFFRRRGRKAAQAAGDNVEGGDAGAGETPR